MTDIPCSGVAPEVPRAIAAFHRHAFTALLAGENTQGRERTWRAGQAPVTPANDVGGGRHTTTTESDYDNQANGRACA